MVRRGASAVALSLALLAAIVCISIAPASAAEHYTVYVQQGTGDWSFISFYPLRLTIRPNDTVTFVQSYDVGLMCLPAPGVSTAVTYTLPSDPAYTYLNRLSVPTDDPDFGISVVSSATETYSAGVLYAPDLVAKFDPTGSLGLRSNWTFEFPIEGVFTFQELFQEMTIQIYVTALDTQLPFTAAEVAAAVATQRQRDVARIPCLLQNFIEPKSAPARDSSGRWVVYTGYLETTEQARNCSPAGVTPTGLGVYNRFVPGPLLSIGEGDEVYFVNPGAHPHAVAFNRTGEVFAPQYPLVYDLSQLTYKYTAVYNSPSFPNADGDVVFSGDNFVTLGVLSQANAGLAIKFTQQGVFSYVCFIHIELGMEAAISVGPASAAAHLAPLALLPALALALAALL